MQQTESQTLAKAKAHFIENSDNGFGRTSHLHFLIVAFEAVRCRPLVVKVGATRIGRDCGGLSPCLWLDYRSRVVVIVTTCFQVVSPFLGFKPMFK